MNKELSEAKKMNMILTVPANVDFSGVAKESAVSGVRLNTTYTGDGSQTIEEILQSMVFKASGKDVWIDLKARQPRIESYNVDILRNGEVHKITLTHPFELDTSDRNNPVEVILDDGYMRGIVKQVEGKTLVIPSDNIKREGLFFPGPGQIGIRPGTSVNILHPSFKIKGFYTKNDVSYLKAARKLGMHKYMLSYVEEVQDVLSLFKVDPKAEVVLKIETPRGLEFVAKEYPGLKKRYGSQLNLMTARGDLYIEVGMPDQIIDASLLILENEPNAILASRLMGSLKYFPEKDVECSDVTDLYCNMMLGYKQFMVGDELTTREERIIEAIGLFDTLVEKYKRYNPQQKQKRFSIKGLIGRGLPDTAPNQPAFPMPDQSPYRQQEKQPSDLPKVQELGDRHSSTPTEPEVATPSRPKKKPGSSTSPVSPNTPLYTPKSPAATPGSDKPTGGSE